MILFILITITNNKFELYNFRFKWGSIKEGFFLNLWFLFKDVRLFVLIKLDLKIYMGSISQSRSRRNKLSRRNGYLLPLMIMLSDQSLDKVLSTLLGAFGKFSLSNIKTQESKGNQTNLNRKYQQKLHSIINLHFKKIRSPNIMKIIKNYQD